MTTMWKITVHQFWCFSILGAAHLKDSPWNTLGVLLSRKEAWHRIPRVASLWTAYPYGKKKKIVKELSVVKAKEEFSSLILTKGLSGAVTWSALQAVMNTKLWWHKAWGAHFQPIATVVFVLFFNAQEQGSFEVGFLWWQSGFRSRAFSGALLPLLS